MLQSAITNYYKLFDEKLQNSTCIVLMVAFLVLLVGAIAPVANASSMHLMKSSILEASNSKNETPNVIHINGEKYEVIFSKIQ